MRRLYTLLAVGLACTISLQAATVFTDNFNRANNADLGANWDNGFGTDGPAQIVSNRVRATTIGTSATEAYNGSLANDQWAQIDIPTLSASNSQAPGLILRASAPGANTFYIFQAANFGTDSYEVVSGAGSNIAACSDSTPWVAGDQMYAQIIGTAITIRKNGASLHTCTGAGIASGHSGLHIFTNSNLADVEIDNFVTGDFTGQGHRGRFFSWGTL